MCSLPPSSTTLAWRSTSPSSSSLPPPPQSPPTSPPFSFPSATYLPPPTINFSTSLLRASPQHFSPPPSSPQTPRSSAQVLLTSDHCGYHSDKHGRKGGWLAHLILSSNWNASDCSALCNIHLQSFLRTRQPRPHQQLHSLLPSPHHLLQRIFKLPPQQVPFPPTKPPGQPQVGIPRIGPHMHSIFSPLRALDMSMDKEEDNDYSGEVLIFFSSFILSPTIL